MNITFECADKINGKLTAVVEKTDYEDLVKKALKDYRKRAEIPGFRVGNVPMSLIQKKYGAMIKLDEINKLISEKVQEYIRTNDLQILGSPMPQPLDESVDFVNDDTITFTYDIAIAPEFELSLTKKNKVPFYEIKVDDELINKQIEMYASRSGKHVKAKSYKDNDMLKGDLRQQGENGDAEGGIVVEGAVLMPSYFKDEEQKKAFAKCKPNDIITFNPFKAYEGSEVELSSLLKIEKEAAKEMKADFTYQVTEIMRYQNAKIDQELFDAVFGKDACKTEEEFRAKIAEGLKEQFKGSSDYRFITDLREYCEKKVGKLQYPEELLKKMMLSNNKDKDEKFVEDNFEASLKQLTWHLIREKLVKQTGIKIDDNDIKAAAIEMTRAQFAQYGMTNIPDELVEKYAGEMMQKEDMVNNLVDRSIDSKLTVAMKEVVALTHKEVTLDEFNKLYE
ncbi:MAG: trigger factor [Prevotella sp.]|nr:trigger factor [Prevotella sp.]